MTKVDVLIAGGGIAGLLCAAALHRQGRSVVLVDPNTPDTQGTSEDWRSTAFLQRSQALFEHIGLWERLAPHATPLDALRIVDTDQNGLRDQRVFDSADKGDAPFGWNFLNWVMRREVLSLLSEMDGVELVFGVGVKALNSRTSESFITLTDGRRIRAQLAVGADGRTSTLRRAAGIDVAHTDYGQSSLAFAATHELPHNNISTEVYREGGPFTLVPLPDQDGTPCSAVVWMNKTPLSQELRALDEAAFNAQMTARAAGLYGEMKLASPVGIFPIITQTAKALTAERLALIAEAAHVYPPIGAQGLNTSINDIWALLEAADTHAEFGGPQMLDAYAKARQQDIKLRARAVDLFNRVTRSDDTRLQTLRLMGLKAAHDIAPLRKGLMHAGLNPL